VRAGVVVAIIAALPPTLAAVLGYFANSRSIRRSVGAPPGIPLARALERIDEKVERLVDGQAAIRERLAHLEGLGTRRGARPRAVSR
jgi:hypothetical protein